MQAKVVSVLDLSSSQLTPGMKQYQEAKRAHPECIVMLRMGDFYELFYEDAITAARELGITLTARGKGEKKAPLAGVPYHALDNYLSKLVKKGYKVAIVEQLEDPKQAKGLVKRGVVRIVTPGTVIESSLLEEKENNYILAVTSHQEKFAIAGCDLSTGEFFTSLLEDASSLMDAIARYSPSECILPQSLLVNAELAEKIKAKGTYLNSLEDYFFKESRAREILLHHFQLRSLDSLGLEEEKLNIAVSGALLKYLMETQKNSLSHIKKLHLKSNHHAMIVDSSTFRNLELIRNIKDGGSKGTLLSVLDKTSTSLGARLLRKWLKNPLLQKLRLERRQNAIAELNKNVIIREEVINFLQDVYDLERLVSRINYGSANPHDLLALQRSLAQIPKIKEQLSTHNDPLLRKIAAMEGFDALAKLIKDAVREDASITIREGGIIKPGHDKILAELYDIKINGKKYLQELANKEKEKTGIQNLKICFNKVFGYFIEITKKNIHLVPEHYIRKQTTANAERYVTEELKLEEEKILGAEEKIAQLEYSLFQGLLKTISSHTESLQNTARRLAVLDVLSSLAKVAMENNYVRPQFVDNGIIQIRKGRHPVVERTEATFITNDVLLQPGEMMVITGPNMAGKSTCLRQVALIVLMAQIGSFVPAEEAILGVVDRIFTRVGAYDDLSSGQSTFMVEMNETASILNNATENSLIILDEIGRGTSTFDGVSIAWSVAEYIYNQIKAKTMFATHYHVMNKLAEKCANVKNYNIAVQERKGEIIFLRKLIPGGTDQSYGVHVAKLAGLPDEVIARAREIQQHLEKDDEMVQKLKVKKLSEQKSLGEF